MKKPGITRLIELQRILIQFNNLPRQVYHSDRQESDTEHSYALAMAGWFLAQYFPELNTDKVIRLALAHDLVELHAGDTFAYAEKAAHDTKAEREAAAYKRLQKDWSDFPEMIDSISEYEARTSSEAKFVYALDKLMPALLNYLNKGDIWRMHNITFEQFMAEKEAKMPVSSEIYDYYVQLRDILSKHPEFFTSPGKERIGSL